MNPPRRQWIAASVVGAIVWIPILALLLFLVAGCRSAEGARGGAHLPMCLYQCQGVTIELPEPQDQVKRK